MESSWLLKWSQTWATHQTWVALKSGSINCWQLAEKQWVKFSSNRFNVQRYCLTRRVVHYEKTWKQKPYQWVWNGRNQVSPSIWWVNQRSRLTYCSNKFNQVNYCYAEQWVSSCQCWVKCNWRGPHERKRFTWS